MHDYLTLGEVLTLHEDQVNRFGGTHGVRDWGQLQSALFRPQTGYYLDLIAEAAALWESLSQNHPFLDGNKRTALAATMVFLEINGMEVTAKADDLWGFLSECYEKQRLSREALEAWLRVNTASARPYPTV
ncbi:type II toxin-antitoxin system death-on-curing family toxin [Rhodothalassium salexigens]|uniref:type II toxin-antitoxin system death-on-curing family toxin n=1 Tax=Rhodothalassium salexigens TaxID=1086 RepID=UPI00104A0E45|nr:type II toxin-antitoxin system death-on-curing family toxin [Rhodothalassium salexigens]MBB4210791.1 death-on-curing protein [Rhodothalassium salexigens DSM 2132]MBK1639124.1 type II toxin-antitoxin system death-on-curing family toxin [Rhodothalassium salexigens DSM 2132]